jgi:hypothetical protein
VLENMHGELDERVLHAGNVFSSFPTSFLPFLPFLSHHILPA